MSNAKTIRKNRTHARILESAGNLMREKGISGASVANVMEGADMTVGGFYSHFPSKQSLVAEALRQTLRRSRSDLAAGAAGKKGKDWVRAIARSYLSRWHRDHADMGCPLPAILSEAAREDLVVRKALAREVKDMADELAARLGEPASREEEAEALAILSTMIGGLALSRAVKDTDLSDRVLLACRRQIERLLD
jgi:TetR/AcrR family transcriptional repressor of nem operon